MFLQVPSVVRLSNQVLTGSHGLPNLNGGIILAYLGYQSAALVVVDMEAHLVVVTSIIGGFGMNIIN